MSKIECFVRFDIDIPVFSDMPRPDMVLAAIEWLKSCNPNDLLKSGEVYIVDDNGDTLEWDDNK